MKTREKLKAICNESNSAISVSISSVDGSAMIYVSENSTEKEMIKSLIIAAAEIAKSRIEGKS